jgi:hypothetical protein
LPAAVNDRGEVAGIYYADANQLTAHGFVYHNGHVTTVDIQGSTYTGISKINNLGEVAGVYRDASGQTYGFTDYDGHITTISIAGSENIEISAMNNWGEVGGVYNDASGEVRGFIYYNGHLTTLPDANATTLDTLVTGINDSGRIVGGFADATGLHGFLLA